MFNRSDVTKKWRDLATDLNLEYKEGQDGLRELFEKMSTLQMSSFSMQEAEQLEKALDSPLVLALLGNMFPGAIIGRYREYDVLISHTQNKRGDRSYPAVHIALFHHYPIDLEFSVKSQDFFGGLAERIFRSRYIQLGDEQLDPLVLVQGEDETQIQLWLNNLPVRNALLKMYGYSNGFEVNHKGLMWHSKDGNSIEAELAYTIMDYLADTADALQGTV